MKQQIKDVFSHPEPMMIAFVVAFTAIIQVKTGFLF